MPGEVECMPRFDYLFIIELYYITFYFHWGRLIIVLVTTTK